MNSLSTIADELDTLRPTIAEVNLAALRHNLSAIRTLTGTAQVMGVVKANAYGHGLLRTAQELIKCGVEQLGVAFLEEGIALRKGGITAPILVLGGIFGNQIEHFLRYDLMLTASSVFKLGQIDEIAARLGTRAKVHLKIDTGMERIGIHHFNADKLFDAALSASHCDIVGVFSHFAASHSADPGFTRLQFARFMEAIEFFPRHGHAIPLRHIANSGAILQHPATVLDMARPGIMLYGVYPDPATRHTVELRPVLSLKTHVVYFKVVQQGASVGYDGTWTAPADTRIVTLPVGYGDGYRRSFSNRATVLISGQRYPIVGTISMDQLTVDIGGDSAYNGDEVVLLGSQGEECISAEDLAELAHTCAYEILTNINSRVPRTYVDG